MLEWKTISQASDSPGNYGFERVYLWKLAVAAASLLGERKIT